MTHPLPDRALQSNVSRGVNPESPLLWLFHWYFKPLTGPQTFNTFVIHLQASVYQQDSKSAIAISAILTCQLNHVSDQAFLLSLTLRQPPLCGSMLAQNAANMSLRYLQLAEQTIDAGAWTPMTQKFPDAVSFKISLSSVRSETAHCRRSFSLCSRFSSFLELFCAHPVVIWILFCLILIACAHPIVRS
jgi:hypothetical protein